MPQSDGLVQSFPSLTSWLKRSIPTSSWWRNHRSPTGMSGTETLVPSPRARSKVPSPRARSNTAVIAEMTVVRDRHFSPSPRVRNDLGPAIVHDSVRALPAITLHRLAMALRKGIRKSCRPCLALPSANRSPHTEIGLTDRCWPETRPLSKTAGSATAYRIRLRDPQSPSEMNP